ncbi:putative ATP-dependent DNA helicase Q1 [Dendronephthya gigantea]|uniref:putative ATP-dependent DNA helicase Q1 n=1 Tax=Dendronephthya gigantea TaxID=151771 RepID=UPI00106B5205|nr:putative ATP-dependent DNA helicase Q1 [Dendronephthya gigantea]
MILESVSSEDNHIRVVICTIAFGMGINCRGVDRVILFGPSTNVKCYMQECGRAGRDGRESTCILQHNRFLASHCSENMKDFVKSDRCRWKNMEHFPGSHVVEVNGCKCCDVCAKKCTCSGFPGKCRTSVFLEVTNKCSDKYKFKRSQTVSDQQRLELKTKLLNFLATYIKPVLYPNVFLEFGKFNIGQILQNCHQLFSVEDVCNCVEIWRTEHAINILLILSEVFNDVDANELQFEADDIDEYYVDSEWAAVRDDSDFFDVSMNESNVL